MMGLEYMIYITGSADWKDEGDLVVGSGMYLFGIYSSRPLPDSTTFPEG